MVPTRTENKAASRTAAEEISLISLIWGFLVRSISSAVFSIAVLIPSATKTIPALKTKKSHSKRLIPRKKPQKIISPKAKI